MATLIAVNPRVAAGPVMETKDVLIKNGQSWKAGQFLRVDNAGLLVAAATGATSATVGGFQYLALTDQANPGNSTTYARVGVIHPDHEFEMNENASTLAGANIGQRYGIVVASNVVTFDKTDATNIAVVVVDIGQNYNPLLNSTDDVKARARVRVLTEVINAARAA
jgi:tRNA-binding EMAP/Myf-like protein